MFNEDENEDWSEFKPQPETGDLKVLNDHIKQADEIQLGLKKLNDRCEVGKAKLKDLLEKQIPELMARCGFSEGDSVSYGGVTVTVKQDTYSNVPSLSSIEAEKDDARRAELMDRRVKGLAILEEKAPSIVKRKFEIEFEKEDVEKAKEFAEMLDSMENPPQYMNSLSVHPQTLTRWVNEKKKEGYNFTPEEEYAFGLFPRRVAKIKR